MPQPIGVAAVPGTAPLFPTISLRPAPDTPHPFLVVSRGGTTVIVGEESGWTVIDLPRPPMKEDQDYLLAHGIPPWVVGRPATNAEIVDALKAAIEQMRKVARGEAETA
jgi:hypothetical protein